MPAAICSNDAKSCYTWIILIVAVLMLCHLGTSKHSIQSMILILHNMNHHLWSSFGDSKNMQNRIHWRDPVAGIGQGNRAGPQIWAAVSAWLFQVLLQDSFVATFICSLLHHHRSLAGFGFIDDMDLCLKPQTTGTQWLRSFKTVGNGQSTCAGIFLVSFTPGVVQRKMGIHTWQ